MCGCTPCSPYFLNRTPLMSKRRCDHVTTTILLPLLDCITIAHQPASYESQASCITYCRTQPWRERHGPAGLTQQSSSQLCTDDSTTCAAMIRRPRLLFSSSCRHHGRSPGGGSPGGGSPGGGSPGGGTAGSSIQRIPHSRGSAPISPSFTSSVGFTASARSCGCIPSAASCMSHPTRGSRKT
jgi:hypothetical protein